MAKYTIEFAYTLSMENKQRSCASKDKRYKSLTYTMHHRICNDFINLKIQLRNFESILQHNFGHIS